jgi:hypothetical protein
MHALFKLGIDECIDDMFVCNIGRETPHAAFLLSAQLIVIDEVSMLTPWVAERASRVLNWLAEEDGIFGGLQMLFVGDLLQLPPVVPNFGMPVGQRLITRARWWPVVKKCRIERPMRSRDDRWNDFLLEVAKGRAGPSWTWEDLKRLGVTVTEDPRYALDFFLHGIAARGAFLLDCQWIAATNKLANEVNAEVQAWRKAGGAPSLGVCRARTELITPFPNCPRLAEQLQIDYVERLECPDLPPTTFEVLEGDVLLLLWNVNTREGLAKGRRCIARKMGNRALVVAFGPETEYTFGAIRMDKKVNGVEFVRWQVPFRLMYGGTVHRSQGMTLDRAVMDCRTKFWEHGQLYVARFRVRSPRGLCVLLPPGMMNEEIAGPVDERVVAIVESMGSEFDGGGEGMGFEDFEESGVDAPGPSSFREVSSDDELGIDEQAEGPGEDG